MAASQEELLLNTARDGNLDVSQWPVVLEDVLKRLQKIVSSEFPLPTQLPPTRNPDDVSNQSTEGSQVPTDLSQQTSGTDKENTAPLMPPPAAPIRRPLPDASGDPLSLHPELAASYQSSISILKESFATSPPYTVQRLAELVLHPRKHYRFLPPYLSALDRVVSVSSPTTSFPLPNHSIPNGILHTNGGDEASTTSGDEGLGGALLTPIPWLRNPQHSDDSSTTMIDGELHTEDTETIDGPNGAGRIETVSVTVNGIHSSPHTRTFGNAQSGTNGGMTTEQELRAEGAVTQGELLRQEQEAGVIPVSQVAARRALGTATAADEADGEETPHARGPEEIGMEDLGPQEGALGAGRPLDIEAALGRGHSLSPEPATAAPAPVDGESSAEQPEQ